MISYSSMTLKQAADEVMLRIAKLTTSANFDYQLAVMYLNRARRDAMATSLPFKDWSYIKTFAISNNIELPQDFIGVARVILKDPAAEDYREARRLDPKEWWTMTNTHRAHSWNGANNLNPVYTIWGSDDSSTETWNSKGLVIKVGPSTVSGYIEYYAEYGDMSADSDTLNVPYEFENLVIMMAVDRIYHKLGETAKAPAIYKEWQNGIMTLRKQLIAKRQSEGLNVQSLTSNMPTTIQSVGRQ